MAKSTFEIGAEYDQALRRADSLDQMAREMKNLAERDLTGCMSRISASWMGESSEAYVDKCGELRDRMIGTAEGIAQAAQALRVAAGKKR